MTEKEEKSGDEKIIELQVALEKALRQVEFHRNETKEVLGGMKARIDAEVINRTIEARKDLYRKLFPVVELLKLTCASINDNARFEDIRSGVDMVYQQMLTLLNIFNIEKIKTVGEKFDPNFHEAIMQDGSGKFPKNIIVQEFESGFILDGKLLKPAKVSVSM
ncbi:nucleotide exchange factor GrpE [Candidatus Falkowbacteria bacterium RIFOXYB2_FULL_34_18]|uniref:Protein GrpE n=1 Tax=Candidatus Falkowbacteria bacterium RIFOXYD2_FULL_34_120 TaxID=1798007 RepID=A0A1F5TSR8_9BACT|nr:MAG: nucleotide exchange factor GrpE [Candidatus Falkowbacteria bacterium RIFOXYB2_FULL_34_18]OGF30080.1 MAG: nucleotide exchange factor GrpE [Candidatus Falkowbacteria bacterium RIFOXYC12_FULL_34_55]OGF37586.1 MAG: nucleotide exchange factor GrpE [Candidatus Falkowbacteria bacterium RIFOXYC2_FULL_34_220]OGF39342.1 MAG: nucleotide exchange factor GrpE [Candidatus Falkowbacteria bacterium RIFOXYD12_FULL_34_57]OGF41847.1 MAG: nucleotide exchange factor GrpE [Candidatus Falkowbacteria bacterium